MTKDHHLRLMVFALAVLLSLSSAAMGDKVNSSKKWSGDGIGELFRDIEKFGDNIHSGFDYAGMSLKINTDPILRQIVCRVSYQAFEIAILARTLGLKEKKVREAVAKLQQMGLVQVRDLEQLELIVPADAKSGAAMRRFAREWCATDDECGIAP